MTKLLICVVSLLVYLAFQIFPCESQTITVNPSGTWTEGSSVTMTCTISSYSGEMKWKLGSTDVAKCTPQTCSMMSTGEGAFLFAFDTTNHIFTWTIDPVKYSNNGNIFYCFDGTNTANYTATVQTIPVTSTPEPPEYQTVKALAITGFTLALIAIIVVLVLRFVWQAQPNTDKNGAMDGEEKIKQLITGCLKRDETLKNWMYNKEEIKQSISEYMKKDEPEAMEKDEPEAMEEDEGKTFTTNTLKIEYSIKQYLKKDGKMEQWLNDKTMIEKLISEYLNKEENARLKAMNKEDAIVKCLSEKKKTLYPLIEKCLYQDETMTKWLSDQNAVKCSIAECLAEKKKNANHDNDK